MKSFTIWIGAAAVLALCFWAFRYGVPMVTNRFLVRAIDPQHQFLGDRLGGVHDSAVQGVGQISGGPMKSFLEFWNATVPGPILMRVYVYQITLAIFGFAGVMDCVVIPLYRRFFLRRVIRHFRGKAR